MRWTFITFISHTSYSSILWGRDESSALPTLVSVCTHAFHHLPDISQVVSGVGTQGKSAGQVRLGFYWFSGVSSICFARPKAVGRSLSLSTSTRPRTSTELFGEDICDISCGTT